jgi:hypothetical protein
MYFIFLSWGLNVILPTSGLILGAPMTIPFLRGRMCGHPFPLGRSFFGQFLSDQNFIFTIELNNYQSEANSNVMNIYTKNKVKIVEYIINGINAYIFIKKRSKTSQALVISDWVVGAL